MSPLPILFAFVAALALHGIALRVFPRIGLLDYPERYGLKRSRLPYPTGIIAPLLFLCFLPFLTQWTTQDLGLFAAVALLALSCFIDDRAPLPSFLRLALHMLAALLLFLTGTRIYTLTNPLFGLLPSPIFPLDTFDVLLPGLGPVPVLSGIFTIIWLTLTINAMNWFDGIPGQASVLSAIGFLVIGLLSLSDRIGQPELASLSLVLAAIALASTLLELPVPRVIPGDSGSMFFGLLLGTLTIYAGGKVATAFLVLGVPIVDSALVILQRLWKGHSPFRGSQQGEHLHHRLRDRGWSNHAIIALNAGTGLLFGISALFLDTRGKFIAAVALIIFVSLLSWGARPRNGTTNGK